MGLNQINLYTLAFKCTPKEFKTFTTVSNLGFEPFLKVLYKLSRPKPVSFAIWLKSIDLEYKLFSQNNLV